MNTHGRNTGIVMGSLLASSATLLCCVLPAVMVSIGAGATLMALVSSFPQLVWLSEHKGWVFGLGAALLSISGVLIWRARYLPCPSDPVAARHCMTLRRLNSTFYVIALLAFGTGASFAYVVPNLPWTFS